METLIVDSTLREGDQAPGLVIPLDQKEEIARRLINSGLTRLEAGIPAMGDEDISFLKSLKKQFPRVQIVNWCRAVQSDIEAACKTDTGAVHISFPVSPIQLGIINRSWNWVLEQLEEMRERLGRDFDYVSAGAMDASRTDGEGVKEFVHIAKKADYKCVRLADTVGIMGPEDIGEWADLLKDHLPLLEFHGHNDLSMAVANTITAMDRGFGAVSATLLGLGERAGNAPLEEIILAAQIRNGTHHSLDLRSIAGLARETATRLSVPLSPTKPLLGSRINSHESGIHVAGLKKDPRSFTPYDPERFGGSIEQIVWGRQSGRKGLGELLRVNGYFPTSDELDRLLRQVRRLSRLKGGAVEPEAVISLYNERIAL